MILISVILMYVLDLADYKLVAIKEIAIEIVSKKYSLRCTQNVLKTTLIIILIMEVVVPMDLLPPQANMKTITNN